MEGCQRCSITNGFSQLDCFKVTGKFINKFLTCLPVFLYRVTLDGSQTVNYFNRQLMAWFCIHCVAPSVRSASKSGANCLFPRV